MRRVRGALLMCMLLAAIVANVYATTTGEKIGDSVSDFTLNDLEGNKHHLREYLNKGPVALWFTNLCSNCQQGLPQLKQTFDDKKIKLLIISVLGDDRETPARVAKKHDLRMPILLDPKGMTVKQFSGGYLPDTCPMTNFFVIEKTGRVAICGHYPGLGLSKINNYMK